MGGKYVYRLDIETITAKLGRLSVKGDLTYTITKMSNNLDTLFEEITDKDSLVRYLMDFLSTIESPDNQQFLGSIIAFCKDSSDIDIESNKWKLIGIVLTMGEHYE